MKHLTGAQVDKLTQALVDRTRKLAARVREELAASDQQHFRDIAGTVTDTADEALADALVDMDTAFIDRHVAELRDIEAARDRIRGGTFGVCQDCGEAVIYERLAAYPTAKRCVHCQQKREHNFAHPGRPSL